MTCTQAKEAVASYVKGELSQQHQQAVSEHLSICKSCQRLFSEATSLVSILREKTAFADKFSNTEGFNFNTRII